MKSMSPIQNQEIQIQPEFSGLHLLVILSILSF